MARGGEPRIIGRVIVLLLLIIVLAAGGLVWFDYLNVIDAKTVLGPVYNALRGVPFINRIIPPGAGRTQTPIQGEVLSLDAERMFMQLEAVALRNTELDQRELDLTSRANEIEQMAEEMEERQKALDEREKSINAREQDADDKSRNVEQFARYLTGMPPEQAAGIIEKMDDQNAIDVFRKTEEIAQREGTVSIVSYWLSLLPSERAAELQRKMAGRPNTLN